MASDDDVQYILLNKALKTMTATKAKTQCSVTNEWVDITHLFSKEELYKKSEPLTNIDPEETMSIVGCPQCGKLHRVRYEDIDFCR